MKPAISYRRQKVNDNRNAINSPAVVEASAAAVVGQQVSRLALVANNKKSERLFIRLSTLTRSRLRQHPWLTQIEAISRVPQIYWQFKIFNKEWEREREREGRRKRALQLKLLADA